MNQASSQDSPAKTSVKINAHSSWNGVPVWKYRALASVTNMSTNSTPIPQGSVIFHFTDRAAVNRDVACDLDKNGACAVEFTDSLLYYLVTAEYRPKGNFLTSLSAQVGTGR